MTLIGEVFDRKIKYRPHRVTADTGESVVVLRLPPSATHFERAESFQEARRLAGQLKPIPNKLFWYKRYRDKLRQEALRNLQQ